ncbi:MAG: winged helix-turn-helix transcriptional regulator [Cytophagales bacterium]|nr:winged helix-turn-helix transcriptional regulator [Cytophagales bacterium]
MEATTKERTFEKFAKASDMLKAISYPYRLEILKMLEDLEYHPVYEIQAYTGVESTLLSHHLNKMKDKGIIKSYRDGRFIYYKLAMKEIIKVLDCIDNCEI